ncbi:MAG: protease pro-enzyme activation domain-containing protein, partial [Acetobacteraceae bacterium]
MAEAVMELAGSHRSLPERARPLGPVAPAEVLRVSLYLRRHDEPGVLDGAASLAERRMRLASHRREGHAADLRRIAAFAAAAGLHVDAAYPERRLVRLSGPAARMEAAFATRLTRYEAEGGRFRARAGTLSVPAEIAGIVESVLGLDDRPLARRGRSPMRPAQAGQGLLPNQVAALYGYPASARATGQTIGLIELGGGFDAADTAAAFAAMGIPVPAVAAVSVDGATNSPSGGGADGEVALDIQIAGGAAPGAALAVYFAPNSDAGFADALAAAIHDGTHGAGVVSISWGASESVWTGQAVATM